MARMWASISICLRSHLMWPSSFLSFLVTVACVLSCLVRGALPSWIRAHGLEQSVGAELGEFIVETFGGFATAQGDGFLQEDVAGVEAFIHPHDGHAGLFFTSGNGGVNRRSTAILRQKRGVEIEAAEPGEFEDFLGQNLAVSCDDDEVGLEIFELGDEAMAPIFSG